MSSTSGREGQMVSGARDRCLLHEAAKYGKVGQLLKPSTYTFYNKMYLYEPMNFLKNYKNT